jgi:HEAT repeat protein
MSEYDESKCRSRRVAVKRVPAYGLLICFAVLLGGYLWICFSIRSSVREISAKAVQEYSGDRVEALMKYVESENHSLRQRNRAVWALGQIGDSRALPVL